MDIQKDYFCLEHNKWVVCKNVDLDFDFQETLPAYVDDVYRVVKCCARSFITNADISFNEIKVYGKVNICITYFNENSGLCYADFEEDFSKSITAENLSDNAFVNAFICDKYTGFRVINQRRIDVHQSGALHIDVYDKVKCPCLKNCENAKLKTEGVKSTDIIANSITRIEFDEEFGIPSDSKSIKRIVSYSANADLSEIRVIKDKALIKGNIDLSVLYIAEDNEIFKRDYSFNVSKIVEISGIYDDDIIIGNVRLGNIFLKAKNLSGDKLDTINVYGDLTVNSIALREEEQNLITDAYVLNYNSNCEYSDFSLLTDGKMIDETRQVNLDFEISEEIKEIKEISLSIISYSYKNSKISSQVRFNAIVINNAGELTSLFKDAEFELSVDDFDNMFASISILSFDYSISSDNTVNVRAVVSLRAYAFNEKNYKLISDINAEGKAIEHPSITVYFGKENENVWDIAKAFSSDEKLIINENSLNGNALNSNQVLIIPKG